MSCLRLWGLCERLKKGLPPRLGIVYHNWARPLVEKVHKCIGLCYLFPILEGEFFLRKPFNLPRGGGDRRVPVVGECSNISSHMRCEIRHLISTLASFLVYGECAT